MVVNLNESKVSGQLQSLSIPVSGIEAKFLDWTQYADDRCKLLAV